MGSDLGEKLTIVNTENIFFENSKNLGFLQLIYDGKSKLYLKNEKYLDKANFQGGYSGNRNYDEFKYKTPRYYLKKENESINLLKPQKKIVLKLFQEQSAKINSFIKLNEIQLKEHDDLVRLIKYYDSL